ncbi:FMN-dependent NADH-azoreductase [Cohnella sp. GCM10012308]|uniref:FMN-dependent NADH-azoreductase n=1 Tax=Cohnella sp. GCM10012308 TaxID=3317329 RepID=UPI0036154E75
MANVLFVKANNRPSEQAVSVKLYNAFFESYKENNPNDTITVLDLFAAELPYYDNDMMTGLYKAAQGIEATAEEKKLADLANGYLDQFLAADKIVFAFPLWNFTIPAQLLTYLFYLGQAGKTFKYTAEGPVGLAGDKKVVILNARGGVYSEGPMAQLEMSVNYVKNTLAFWGVTDVTTVIAEGHNQFQDRSQQIIEDSIAQATKLASSF